METNWAAEHLQVIRTLMERSAVYRRALAPVMTFNGVLGSAAAVIGWALRNRVGETAGDQMIVRISDISINSPRAFIFFWACVGALAVAGSFLLVRRQALKESEPFWSPPTRRITQAMLPALVAGFIVGAVVWVQVASAPDD